MPRRRSSPSDRRPAVSLPESDVPLKLPPGRYCENTKRNGEGCQAMAMVGSRYCFFHNPETQKARRAAQQRGGQSNQAAVLPADAADVQLKSARDIATLLAQTINQARRGQIAPKIAGTIGYLASSLVKILETSNTEERLAKVERALKARGPDESLFNLDE